MTETIDERLARERLELPWTVEEYDADQIEIMGRKEIHVAFLGNNRLGREFAAHIVRAVNSHADLVAALRECHKIGELLGAGVAAERISASNGGRMIRQVASAALTKANQ